MCQMLERTHYINTNENARQNSRFSDTQFQGKTNIFLKKCTQSKKCGKENSFSRKALFVPHCSMPTVLSSIGK